eukprot:4483005-Pyramimonas_sp.AAC.1
MPALRAMRVRTAVVPTTASSSSTQPRSHRLGGSKGSFCTHVSARIVCTARNTRLSAHQQRSLHQRPLENPTGAPLTIVFRSHPAGFSRARLDSRGTRLGRLCASASGEERTKVSMPPHAHPHAHPHKALLSTYTQYPLDNEVKYAHGNTPVHIDLGTRLQRALNLDRYDDAQALRAKIEEVEAAITRHEEQKTGGEQKSQDRVTDRTAEGLRLRFTTNTMLLHGAFREILALIMPYFIPKHSRQSADNWKSRAQLRNLPARVPWSWIPEHARGRYYRYNGRSNDLLSDSLTPAKTIRRFPRRSAIHGLSVCVAPA